MRLSDLDVAQVRGALQSDGLYIRFGPFVTRLRSNAPTLASHLVAIYPHHEVASGDFAESTITIHVGRNRRRPWEKLATLRIDERDFMYPLKERMAVPMLEWGMNWVIASRAHQFLLCHAAVLEKSGSAILMPAVSGAGKSTLCALLLGAGWRLFSDEFAVVRPHDLALLPMPRAISLKNQSIALARGIHPDAPFTDNFEHTIKGTLAFMGAPREALERSAETAPLRMIVFPKFDASTSIDVEPVGRAAAFSDFVAHSMNYAALGERGFRCVAALMEGSPAFKLTYGDPVQAIEWFDRQAGLTT